MAPGLYRKILPVWVDNARIFILARSLDLAHIGGWLVLAREAFSLLKKIRSTPFLLIPWWILVLILTVKSLVQPQ